jgi:hypothetical protein
MIRRILICGGIALAVLAVILWVQMDDSRNEWRRGKLWRLWYRGGTPIAVAAGHAAGASGDNATGAPGPTCFFPWTEWPAESKAWVTRDGLTYVGTQVLENLMITEFVTPDTLDARWFYVVPEPREGVRRWFLVVAMDSEVILYGDTPTDSGLVFETQHAARTTPLDVVLRVCRRRNHEASGRYR